MIDNIGHVLPTGNALSSSSCVGLKCKINTVKYRTYFYLLTGTIIYMYG